ncbi:ABC transporter permease [Pelagibacterium lentulum]|uniref:ABC transporter permease n=1 Tax=Pelagibacterium lentulum TaxID=2029865 RepID=A0A916R791_9HYPH|nr:ABC transporter permease [Pelagibacterium lentulum]GGA39593.1 ABC transporter permease [Pelagibacterium lentulum]
MRIERRPHRPLSLIVLSPIIAIAAALAVSGGLIAIAGANPFVAYGLILRGAFGSILGFTEMLTRATPLILTGLAAAVAFRAKVWNIGGEGQFYIGAIAVAAFASGSWIAGWPPVLVIPMAMAAGAIAGMAMLLVPLGLRLKFGVDEVVTSLLLNFVALLFVSMMIEGPLRDPLAFGWPSSVPVVDAATLPKLIERTRVHIGLIVAIGLAFAIYFIQARTVFGLQSRAAGLNAPAARFAGVPWVRTLVIVACMSGGLAGLAGAIEVMGVRGYVASDLSPGYGYSGIIVAMLANLHPIGVIAAALFAAIMFVGSDSMSRALGIPSYIADVTVALSLLTMLVSLFFTQYRIVR